MNTESIVTNGRSVEFTTGNDSQLDQNIVIENFTAKDEASIVELIRSTMASYQEAGSVLASSFRRIERFKDIYEAEGALYIVAKDGPGTEICLGGAGIGPLHGLPPGEGVGELRDLVVSPNLRGKGIGSRLIKRCLEQAKKLGYKRLYLEITPQMEHAQKLFQRYGFRPITESSLTIKAQNQKDSVPCYFLLEEL